MTTGQILNSLGVELLLGTATGFSVHVPFPASSHAARYRG